MNLVIHQPLFLPYIGMYQEFACADVLYYLDSQMMKGHFVNRNRIWSQDKIVWLTLPLAKKPLEAKISEMHLADDWKPARIEGILYTAYRKAPYYDEVIAALFPEGLEELGKLHFIDRIAFKLNERIFNYLHKHFPPNSSSKSYIDAYWSKEKGTEKILKICQTLQNNLNNDRSMYKYYWDTTDVTYVNASGGRDLYRKEDFDKIGVSLKFIKPYLPVYKDNKGVEIPPGLSIIDVLMWNDKEQVKEWLHKYELVD